MLDHRQVVESEIVANSVMNRERCLAGVNSYARELRFDPLDWLAHRVKARGRAVWYDACCGEGRALREASATVAETVCGDAYRFIGVDLVTAFSTPKSGPSLFAADVMTFAPEEPVDLITFVHGLHYLSNKLAFLEHAYRLLAPGGLLIGHLDLNNVRLASGEPLSKRIFEGNSHRDGTPLSLSRHLLKIEKTAPTLSFGLRWIGASISEKTNYTGIKQSFRNNMNYPSGH